MWTVQNLPPGIAISGTSTSMLTLSGTPTTAGIYTITAAVTDTKSRTDTYTGTITVTASAVLTINGSLPFTGSVGTPYSGTLSATRGVAPYTWLIDALPTGVTAAGTNSATVTVSGTPTASGSFQVAITLTDSANNTAKSIITVSISSSATLAITGSLPATGTVGTAYSGSLTATGGTAPYTWQRLRSPRGSHRVRSRYRRDFHFRHAPTAATYDSSALVTDSKNSTALYSVTVVVSAAQAAACAVPFVPGGNEAEITKPYAFALKGADSNGQPVAWAGSFTPDGDGGIAAADVDEISGANGPASYQIDLAGSSYSFGSDGSGCLYLAFNGVNVPPPSASVFESSRASRSMRDVPEAAAAHSSLAKGVIFNFQLSAPNQTGRIAQSDRANALAAPSGRIRRQAPADFALARLSPCFAFGIDGWFLSSAETFEPAAMAGSFSFTLPDGTRFHGSADNDIGGEASGELFGAAGTLAAPSAATGHGTGTYTVSTPLGDVSFDFAYYIVSGSDFFLISTDPAEAGDFLLTGRALAAAFPSAPLNGTYIEALTGFDLAVAPMGTARSVVQLTSLAIDTDTSPSVDPETGRATFTRLGNFSPIGYLTANDGGDSIAAFLVGTDAGNSSGFLLRRPPATNSPLSLLSDFEDRAAQNGARPFFKVSEAQAAAQ